MTKKEKIDAWLGIDFKPRLLVHFFTFSVLLSGAISERAHSRSREMEISARSLPERSGRGSYRVDGHTGDNETIRGENVLPSTALLHRMLDEDVEKEGRRCNGRSLKFRLGERFAFRKRLQFALLPIMYKMGVMTTLLTGLTVLVLKGLTIGVILLIFAFGNYFTKLHKQAYQSAQPIHVHVHSQDGQSKVTSFPNLIGPWDRVADEVHPNAYLGDDGDLESYRRRLIQNSASMVNVKPLS